MSSTMNVRLAKSSKDIELCIPVMQQLRNQLQREEVAERMSRQVRQGYQLAYVEVNGTVKAVAGFRIIESLFQGRFLYVDDLVTDSGERSKGYGAALFSWLVDYARKENCRQLDLDSGVQRVRAHRFYFQQGMHISSYHFAMILDQQQNTTE